MLISFLLRESLFGVENVCVALCAGLTVGEAPRQQHRSDLLIVEVKFVSYLPVYVFCVISLILFLFLFFVGQLCGLGASLKLARFLTKH